MRVRRAVGALLIGSLALAAGGCGGGGDDQAESPPPSVEGSSAGPGDEVGSTLTGGCVTAVTAMAKLATDYAAAMADGSTVDFRDSVEAYEASAPNAPPEIQADMRTVAEGYASTVAVQVETHFDPTSSEPPSLETQLKLQAAAVALDESDFEEASQRVTAWLGDKCGG
jgi:hypothetical protein